MAYTTITKCSSQYNTKLYTGNGSTQTITGVGMQPDFSWIKRRDGARNNCLFDSVRGVGKTLHTNDTDAEASEDGITAWNSDGFALGSATITNENNSTFASWNWKAGTTSGLTGGTITPSAYSINTTSGFGIYKYTGTGSTATIAHGLGATPQVVITKGFSASSFSWCLGHKDIAWTHELFMNSTNAAGVTSGAWNNTDPTDTLITLGSGGNGNNSGTDFIMFAWTPIAGYSAFGKYDGNAGGGVNKDNFQYCGFKPRFILVKCSTASENWMLLDSEREGYNNLNDMLSPNSSGGEGSDGDNGTQIYSNGFNPTFGTGHINRSGKSYVWMAFGQTIVGTNNVCVTAR